jgi:hypothetical protein
MPDVYLPHDPTSVLPAVTILAVEGARLHVTVREHYRIPTEPRAAWHQDRYLAEGDARD